MDVFSEKVSSLPSAQRSYTSELSWYPEFRSSESSVFGVQRVTKVAAVMMAAELL
jgi:hypothetical protein